MSYKIIIIIVIIIRSNTGGKGFIFEKNELNIKSKSGNEHMV